ncbi:putative flavonoid 3'-monooxygenase [Arabidopsis thaliana]|uniref:CYP78A8 n=5 Tax=Arabidopsis TaxID=3701 RepID=A0A384KEP9_ARATH|nr:cytochrome P450, family 78, subfamily A, polypeptide 8 [Arabidopsis thaliana]ANM60724.1 cytochrome P450, family 78, subfamily A, polypeptide 8 [Arabidopsis thaliana]KAG7644657.1 Cytochrome P450 superfamily [Arabidopsis thaliana x Arabidopsis arenosa]OAP18110.1 CYP78A8 [Arabidopsis thaliana]|eukprot:NP_171627.2 cytochrome P450, family 78, subfamily A, polypeptide 8 [Arabidopsis thaliana]
MFSLNMRTEIESLWVFALASKFNIYMQQHFASLLVAIAITWFTITIVFWSTPGGPAWGKYFFTRRFISLDYNRKYKNLIPGPRGFPLVGSMSLRSSHVAHQRIASVAEMSNAKRLMAFSLGDTKVVVTCHPAVAKEILNSSVFADRPVDETAYGLMFNRAMGFAPNGTYWRTLRRLGSNHLFNPKQIKQSEDQRRVIATQMVNAFARNPKSACAVRDLLKTASLCNMMGLVFGREYELESNNNLESECLKGLVEEGYDLLGTLNWTDHLPWLAGLDFQQIRFRCSQLVPKVNLLLSRIIHEQRAATGNFLDMLLSLQGSEKLSESDMVAVLWEMIFRGTDTVAVLVEWVLARIVMHPKVQLTVHDELDRVVGRSRTVDESDLPSLTYLTAMIKEVLRLHPPGPLLSWARLSITDTSVDGYHVPAGTTAMVNMWAIARDPHVWEDPLEFKPERFVAKEGEAEFSVFGSDLRLAPFGSGKRVCPGKNLGLTTVSFWVATLLHEFEWLPSVEANPPDLSEVLRLSCEMACPLIVNVSSRRKIM